MSPPFPPVEPEPTEVVFPPPENADDEGVVAVGSDFRPGTLLAAYREGIFPWPHGVRGRPGHVVFWFSPERRALFSLADTPHWSRSLRRTLRKTPFRVTHDTAFEAVMKACGDTRPTGTWIIPPVLRGYSLLHEHGFAHSVEVWDGTELVGGIYGIAVGASFAGESMFHLRDDASKIAFCHLVDRLRAQRFDFLDVQVLNPHLASLGCVEVDRAEFLQRLRTSRERPCRFGD